VILIFCSTLDVESGQPATRAETDGQDTGSVWETGCGTHLYNSNL
jgi:hypothetical protein